MDGTVYRYGQFVEYFKKLPPVSFVTQLEETMLRNPLPGDRCVCYPEGRIVNIAMNRVDIHSQYPHGEGSAQDLNERFLSGGRLSYAHLKGRNHNSCHLVANPEWLDG